MTSGELDARAMDDADQAVEGDSFWVTDSSKRDFHPISTRRAA